MIFLQPRKNATLADTLDHYQDAFVSSLTEIAAGANAEDEHNTATKAMKIGLTFFSLVMITAYGSSFTAMLVRVQGVDGVENINDCIYQRCRLCIHHQLASRTRQIHGNQIRYVESPRSFGSSQEAIPWGIQMVKNGSCAAFMVSESQCVPQSPSLQRPTRAPDAPLRQPRSRD